MTAKIVGHERGPKVRIGKYKPKSGYKRHTGFRSSLTRIEVTGIGARKAPAKAESKPAAKAEEASSREAEEAPGSEGPPEGLRRHDRCADLGGRETLEPADAPAALLRAGTRKRKGALAALEHALDSEGRELMAHKKGLGSSKNGRDSQSKRLGVKLFDGQEVKAGMILARQRGTRFRPGPGAGIGRDDTIFATRAGRVVFRTSGEKRTISVTE